MKHFLIGVLLSILLVAPVSAYTIQKGDTLWSLYGSNWKAVAQDNGISDPTKLQIGQEIVTEQTLGSTNYVQSQYFTLYGAGCSSGATTVVLKKFQQIDGTLLTMADFGTKGFGTIEPNNGTQEDQITFTGVTQNANGTATLTGVKWALDVSPYTETAGVRVTHPGGVKFVISNTSAFYNTLTNKSNNEDITGYWTFPTPLSSSSSAPATVGYVNGVTANGVATSSESNFGGVWLASPANASASTYDINSPRALYSRYSTSSPYSGIGAGYIPVTQSNSKLSDSFTDFTTNKTYTGLNTFTATTTMATTTIASSTIDNLNVGTSSQSGTASFNGTVNLNSTVNGAFQNRMATSTASSPLVVSADTLRTTNSTNYIKLKEIQTAVGGYMKTMFGITRGVGGTVNCRIYRNGVAYGTEQTSNSGLETKTEYLWFNPADGIQLYCKTSDGGVGNEVSGSNFRIYYDIITATVPYVVNND